MLEIKGIIHGVVCCSILEQKGPRSKSEQGEKCGQSKQAVKQNKNVAHYVFVGPENSIYFHEVRGKVVGVGVVVD